MGAGYMLRCLACGYEVGVSLGVGFAYPLVYRETMQSAKQGKLGATLKKFLAEHPDGVINPALELARCEKCGEYSAVQDFTMYLPKEGAKTEQSKGRWSITMPAEDVKYVSPFEFETKYDAYKQFPHRCGKCRGKVTVLRHVDMKKLKCPHCKDKFLRVRNTVMWD